MTNSPPIGNPTRRRCGQALVLVVVFALIGCYTILQHPITSQEGPEPADHSQEYYRQNCLSCHEDYAEYPYGYFYGVYPEYYFEYPRWGYYYAYPWWWENHWYDGTGIDDTEDATEGPRTGRRGSLTPPYVHGAPALNTGGSGAGYRSNSLPPSATEQTGASRHPTSSSRGQGKTRVTVTGKKGSNEDDEQSDDKTDETKKEKKSTRRGGVPPR
jgi:hypothetical protein